MSILVNLGPSHFSVNLIYCEAATSQCSCRCVGGVHSSALDGAGLVHPSHTRRVREVPKFGASEYASIAFHLHTLSFPDLHLEAYIPFYMGRHIYTTMYHAAGLYCKRPCMQAKLEHTLDDPKQ